MTRSRAPILSLEAFCLGPADGPLDIDSLVSADGPERWSDPGCPTVYLASDIGVLAAEWGRHCDPPAPADVGFWRVHARLERAVDLRDVQVTDGLGLPRDPTWALDRAVTRGLARSLRRAGADGLVVPSVAFLDHRDRGNIVIAADGPRPLHDLVIDPHLVGRWRRASA